jgi:hypothetical protein
MDVNLLAGRAVNRQFFPLTGAELHSNDADFSRVSGLRWTDPLRRGGASRDIASRVRRGYARAAALPPFLSP